jgi:hypothetical protein
VLNGKKETMESKVRQESANDQTSFIIKKIQHPDGVREMEVIEYCVWKKEKEEKKQVGETESELEKKAPHTTHKRMKIFFLKMIQADGHKNKKYSTNNTRGGQTQFLSRFIATFDTIFTFVKL